MVCLTSVWKADFFN